MTTCPSCGAACSDDSRFCGQCGGALRPRRDPSPEHRPVTCLFSDLVGFTELCETADAEDVDRLLHEYYSVARGVIERYGGIVEKFIGDAVVGLFGVPLTHEDDAERAVRAGLRLVDEVRRIPRVADVRAQVRIGLNSGVAIVRSGVDPSSGEGLLMGDVVNTASRLQQTAAPMEVVVGVETHALTSHAIEYDAGPARMVKGKRQPIETWVAQRPIASVGIDLRRTFSTPLVGRDAELGILLGIFETAVATRSPRFALLLGEAGQGKSRLVHELARSLDERPGLVCNWRQGRCPAYGQEGAYHALGEIVRQHAGILESDGSEAAARKLERMVQGRPDAPWLRERLRPLAGLEAPPAPVEERFAAWERFLVTLADPLPAVVVIEDLHWASEGTIAFLDRLADRLADVPLLVIGTARPEFADASPQFTRRFPSPAPSSARLVRLDVKPLSPGQTERLVAALAGEALTADQKSASARQSGGNPLYIEELVRWFEEAGPPGHERDAAGVALAVPTTLKRLIASRLDALQPVHKSLLTDAAVIGEVFWSGTIASMGRRDPLDVAQGLEELATRGLVRRRASSSVEGEDEFAFWHALTREVAYGALTRAKRSRKHAEVARWAEVNCLHQAGLGAQLLAHHYAEALELAKASGDEPLAAELLDPTLSALSHAGRQALGLDVTAAAYYFARALAFAPASRRDRPVLLLDWADAIMQEGRLDEAIPALEQAARQLRAADRHRTAAIAFMRCASAVYWRDAVTAENLREAAVQELADEEPCAELAAVLEESAVQFGREYREAAAVATADEAIALCAALGLPEPVRALAYRGVSLCALGDEEGLVGLRRARRLALHRGLGLDADIVTHLLADTLYPWRGPRASLGVRREGRAQALRRGDEMAVMWFETGVVQDLMCCGRWREALAACDRLEPRVTASESAFDLWELRTLRAQLLLDMGEAAEAKHIAEWSVTEARGNAGNLLTPLAILAAAHHAEGETADALSLLAELEEVSRDKRGSISLVVVLPTAIRVALDAGEPELVARLLEGPCRERPFEANVRAGVLARSLEDTRRDVDAARGYLELAERWRRFGVPPEEAFALTGHARCAKRLGDEAAARASDARARRIFNRLGAPFPDDHRLTVE